MTVAAYKRKWFDEVYAELRGSGLTDTTIASRMEYSRSYFSQVKAADHIGDDFIDKMAATFRKKFVPAGGGASEDQTGEPYGSQKDLRELKEEIVELKSLVKLMAKAIAEK